MDATLEKLVRHCNWANRQLIDFLIAEKIEDAAIVRLACHVANGETAWFERIEELPVNPDVWRIFTLHDLHAIMDEHREFYEYLLHGSLMRVVGYRRFNGDEGQSTVSDILLHLCTHGFHHRGQISSLIAKLGRKPPNLDFINYCRLGGT